MSFYSNIYGKIKYKNHDDLKQVLDFLEMQGYIKNGKFINEDLEEKGNVIKGLTLTIPFGTYRNLGRVIPIIINSDNYYIIETSADGCFEYWIYSNYGDVNGDLEEWGNKNHKEKFDLDKNEDFENYIIWQSEVIDLFFDTEKENVEDIE